MVQWLNILVLYVVPRTGSLNDNFTLHGLVFQVCHFRNSIMASGYKLRDVLFFLLGKSHPFFPGSKLTVTASHAFTIREDT